MPSPPEPDPADLERHLIRLAALVHTLAEHYCQLSDSVSNLRRAFVTHVAPETPTHPHPHTPRKR